LVGAVDDLILEIDGEHKFRNCWIRDEGTLFMPREAFLGRRIQEVFDPAFAGPFLVAVDAVLAGGGPREIDYPSPLPGDPRRFNMRISGLRQDDEAVTGVILAINDITARWEMETALRLSDQQLDERNRELDAILSLSPDGFIAFDPDRRIKYASPALLQILDLSESAPVGQDARGLARMPLHRSVPAMVRSFDEWLQGQFPSPAPEATPAAPYLLELASPYRALEVRARQPATETVSVILYVRDITERMEVDRIKSEFLSTAAHELGTPMASIYGFVKLLLGVGDLAETTRQEMLEIVLRQSKLIIALINERLDLARIEARGGKDFVFEGLDLGSLAREVVAAETESGPRGCRIGLELPPEPVRVRADANKLRQALTNVLSNARTYSAEGGGIQVALRREPGGAGIEVRDRGIGMSPEQVARVCERFYRAETSGSVPGTGLGMSIVKEVMDVHRGRVDIESQPGEGTRVCLWLPLPDPSCGGGGPLGRGRMAPACSPAAPSPKRGQAGSMQTHRSD
jgi:signal transduction histidine kinase